MWVLSVLIVSTMLKVITAMSIVHTSAAILIG